MVPSFFKDEIERVTLEEAVDDVYRQLDGISIGDFEEGSCTVESIIEQYYEDHEVDGTLEELYLGVQAQPRYSLYEEWDPRSDHYVEPFGDDVEDNEG